MSDNQVRKVIIIGGGPAGFTAALYTARANLEPLVIEGFQWGGQLMNTSDVENFPGYLDGILGPEMMKEFRTQAARFGAEFVTDDVVRVDFSQRPFVVATEDAGVPRRVDHRRDRRDRARARLPEEKAFQGRGVSYCAVCDAPFFRDKPVLVVGGGDSAFEEATYIAKFASKVYLVHRREEFRASQIMVDRAKATENVEFVLNAEVADSRRRARSLETVRAALDDETGEDVGHRGRRALRRDRPRPDDRPLQGLARPRRSRLPRDASPARRGRTSPASSPRATCRTTPTARRSPRPAQGAWRRSTPSGSSRRRASPKPPRC